MADESEAVLEANRAFYAAFDAHDPDAMDALWARGTAVACIHPGWQPLHGREGVLASWRSILGSPGAPRIRCVRPRAYVNGASAFVICTEELPGGELVATNLFVREAGCWRLVHHQAGPAPATGSAVEADTGPVH